MEKQDFSKIDDQIKKLSNLLKELGPNLSSGLRLNIYGKYICEIDGHIYRIYGQREGLEKLGLIKFFKEQGLSMFLEEKQLYTKTNEIVITKQEKITPLFLNGGDKECLTILKEQISPEEYQRMVNIFNSIGFMWFGGNNNCGKDKNGKIKIYDWIANISYTNRRGIPQIINTKGEILTNVFD